MLERGRTAQWLNSKALYSRWPEVRYRSITWIFCQRLFISWNFCPLKWTDLEMETEAKSVNCIFVTIGRWCLVIWLPFSDSLNLKRSGGAPSRQAKWANPGNGSTACCAAVHTIVSQALTSLLAVGLFFFVPCLPASLLLVLIRQISLNTYTSCTRLHPNCAVDVSCCLDHLTLPGSHKVKYQPQKWCCT